MFPCASVAEQVTCVEPGANTEPDAGRHVAATLPSTRSVAEAENETAAPSDELAAMLIPDGSWSVGGVVSATVTEKERCALPPASAASQVTRVVPSGKTLPEAGRHETGTLSLPAFTAVGRS